MPQPDDYLSITAKFEAWQAGDKEAEAQLLRLVYPDLKAIVRRQLAAIGSGHQLDTTEYVNETYLELVRQGQLSANSRAQFFGIIGTVVRRLVVDHYRREQTDRRGGNERRVSVEEAMQLPGSSGDGVEYWNMLDEALVTLEKEDSFAARVAELRFFLGMTLEEVAGALEVSLSTVNRGFRFARSWLSVRLAEAKNK